MGHRPAHNRLKKIQHRYSGRIAPINAILAASDPAVALTAPSYNLGYMPNRAPGTSDRAGTYRLENRAHKNLSRWSFVHHGGVHVQLVSLQFRIGHEVFLFQESGQRSITAVKFLGLMLRAPLGRKWSSPTWTVSSRTADMLACD